MFIDEEKFILDFQARVKMIYNYYEEYSKKNLDERNIKNRKLCFSIKNVDEFNGKSWVDDNTDNVTLNKGVFSELIDYYNKWFIPIEDSLKNTKIMQSNFEIFELNLNSNIYPKKISKTEIELMIIFSYRFIILHEFGHLFNGHCDYLRSQTMQNDFRLKMFDNDETTIEAALCRRTLEFDADSFAATQGVLYIVNLMENPKLSINISFDNKFDIPFWFGFSLGTLFLLLKDKKINKQYSKKMLYFPEDIRLCLVFDSIRLTIENYVLDTKILDRIAGGIKFSEAWFNYIKLSKYNIVDMIISDNKFKEYFEEVRVYWKEKLYNELKSFSRLDLYIDN